MAKIYHAHLWGSREDKYRYLQEHDVTTIEWTEIFPNSPFYLFVPQNQDLLSEYNQGWKIPDILPVNSVGIVTARDELTIQFSSKEVEKTVKDFISITVEEARMKYNLGQDVRDWKVSFAQEDVRNHGIENNYIVPILYRLFDFRNIYYTGKSRGFICMPRSEVMFNMLRGENLAFSTTRSIEIGEWEHIFCTCQLIQHHTVSLKEVNYLFVLYRYPNTENAQGNLFTERTSNLSSDFLSAIRTKLGYIPTPEAIFYYIYAIFHSPTYRQRYAEFLKIDFPRVPLTSNDRLFKDLGEKGQELVELHLMKSKKLNKLITKVGGDGDNAVTEVTYKPTEQRVYIPHSADVGRIF